MNIISHPSPNFNARRLPLDYIIIHHTDTRNVDEALAILCQQNRPAAEGGEVSVHYCIARDGRIFQLVDDSQRAWHAGIGNWRGVTDMNSASVGIELDNDGYRYGPTAFPEAQIESLLELLRHLSDQHSIAPENIIGHSDYAPGRKQDPSHLFPWAELALAGFGLWPQQKLRGVTLSAAEANARLFALGYDTTNPDALLAFQLHFCPTERGQGLSQLTKDTLAGFGGGL